MTATNTRPDDVYDATLDWFFNERQGALGLHAMPIEPSVPGHDDTGPSQQQVDAATKARVIHDALTELTQRFRDALQLAHMYVSPNAALVVQTAIRKWREAHVPDIRRALRAYREVVAGGWAWQAGATARRRSAYLAQMGLRVVR